MDRQSTSAPEGQVEALETAGCNEAIAEAVSVLFEILEMQFPGMHASAFLLDKDTGRLSISVSPSFPSELLSVLQSWTAPDVSSPPADAMARRKPVFVTDISPGEGECGTGHGNPAGVHSVWVCPLIDPHGRVRGALALHGRSTEPPDEIQTALLEDVARMAVLTMATCEAEAASRRSAMRMRQLYDTVKDVIFEVRVTPDESFYFDSVNESFLEATGLREDQVVGKSVDRVIPEPSYSLVAENYRKAIRTGQSVSWHEETPYPSGLKTGEVSVFPIFDSEGRCTRLIGTVHDITERRRIENRLRRSEETFRLMFETSQDGILLMNEKRECLRANAAAVKMFGCKDEAEFLAGHALERSPEFQFDGRRSAEYADSVIADWNNKGSRHYEWVYRRKDGSEFVAELVLARMVLDDRPLIQVTIRDITERIRTRERLARITKIYAALGQCNQAIMHAETENELLSEVCNIAVEYGGMRLAWVGILDESTGLLKPVATYGEGTGYLKEIEVSVDADKPTGQGPGGRAYRELRPVWFQDFMSDPALNAWHGNAAKYGWRAVAGLPLYRNGSVVGVFFIYSSTPNAFDKEARRLLQEMAEDISFGLGHIEGKREREKERKELRMLSQVVEQSQNMVVITDVEGCIEYTNPAFERLTGYTSGEVRGKDARFLEAESSSATTVSDLWSRLRRGEAWQGEVVNRKKDGGELITLVHAAPLYTEEDQVRHYLSVAQDITDHRHAEWRVEYLANFDDLTGLPNRVQLQQQFGYAISMAKRSHEHLAIMFIDLDYFSNINDAYGHSVGDILLKKVSQRLKSIVKEKDTLCRLGADEFILMLPQCGADGAAEVASRILEALAVPFESDEHEFIVTASLGISVFPEDGADLETLSRNADMAMFLAKEQGRASYRFFTEEMQARASRTMLLISEMRHAAARGQFEIHYQPLVSGQRIIGVEALLRWNHPELGSVPPAEFIPAAEESGLVVDIGGWVLHEAAQQAKAWLDAGLGLSTMAVNLSPVQFRDENLSQIIVDVLGETQLPPEVLELEITESTAMLNPDYAVSLTKGLNMLGVRFSIDDFGTGYSSLSYLKRFHLHKLKIDRTFVRDLLVDSEDRAIVSTIISMARSLGLMVIAEGVENEEQCHFLNGQGCNEMQGFYFSKPLPADECESFFREWTLRRSG